MLGGHERTAVAVSVMILAYLKELAEKQIGEVIDRAVVTVPAYFNHIQRRQTDEAARKAGFREVVTLLEPVAAALAYSLQSEREQLRVFVYDLGGGTFDATVLEKDPSGGLTVLSFGGDPYLGGDDIDARLVQLILGRLAEQGYRLDLDLKRPADASRYQRLKFYAEIAKKQLSDEEQIQLVRQGLFQDQDDVTVDLDLTISRADLEGCSRDLVQRTIDASRAALAKDGQEIALESIDEVIMVGGMSRMPLVQRMLQDLFQRTPKIVDPDVIVGLGAAVKAAEVFADQEVSATGLRLELRYDRRTDQSPVRISGVFDRVLRGHTVYLLSPGQELDESADGTDRFSFDSVALKPDAASVFTVSVEDADDRPVMQREVPHRPRSPGLRRSWRRRDRWSPSRFRSAPSTVPTCCSPRTRRCPIRFRTSSKRPIRAARFSPRFSKPTAKSNGWIFATFRASCRLENAWGDSRGVDPRELSHPGVCPRARHQAGSEDRLRDQADRHGQGDAGPRA